MAILEPQYTLDGMGRRKRMCPTCGNLRWPGKAFKNEWHDCYYCRRDRTGTRLCKACDRYLPLDQFREEGGKKWRCVDCAADYKREWAANNKDRITEYHRRRYNGLDPRVYEEDLKRTHCPICEREFGENAAAKQNVDHCHKTGEYRGVICGRCNRALGILGDTVESLERAVAYLRGELA